MRAPNPHPIPRSRDVRIKPRWLPRRKQGNAGDSLSHRSARRRCRRLGRRPPRPSVDAQRRQPPERRRLDRDHPDGDHDLARCSSLRDVVAGSTARLARAGARESNEPDGSDRRQPASLLVVTGEKNATHAGEYRRVAPRCSRRGPESRLVGKDPMPIHMQDGARAERMLTDG